MPDLNLGACDDYSSELSDTTTRSNALSWGPTTLAYISIFSAMASFGFTYTALMIIWKYRDGWTHSDAVLMEASIRAWLCLGTGASASIAAIVAGAYYFRRNQATGFSELVISTLVAFGMVLNILLCWSSSYMIFCGTHSGWIDTDP